CARRRTPPPCTLPSGVQGGQAVWPVRAGRSRRLHRLGRGPPLGGGTAASVAGPRMTQPRAPKRPQSWDRSLPSWLLAAWAVTGVLLALLAVFWIRRGEDAVEAEWQSRLPRLADDRLAIAERAVEAWKVEARLLSRL